MSSPTAPGQTAPDPTDLPPSGPAGSTPDYGPALERSARTLLRRQKALDRERQEAGALLPELLRRPADRRLLLLCHDYRFQTWGVLERLLESSRDALFADSRECESLAALALVQADHLEERYYGATRIADMRARAALLTAEARRLRADFAGAGEAFAEARAHLAAGTGDSLEWAALLTAEAVLARCQHRFAPARELLRQAIEIFVENGEGQQAGAALAELAAVDREAQRAEMLLRQAEEVEGAWQELARAMGAFQE